MNNHGDRIAALRAAMYDFSEAGVRRALEDICTPDALFQHCHPFGDLKGPTAFYEAALAPLHEAWPDLERRDWIVMSGRTPEGADWIGCGGHYVGSFLRPWLDIPPTGHLAHMRFHEFYRIENGMMTGFQAIWDIPEVMMQAGAWPMAPSLGREFMVPGPATGDGLAARADDPEMSESNRQLVLTMLEHLTRHPSKGGPEVMEMERFWHPRMNWYGPAGIGSARGIAGFRNWHQIPFLNAMPDRGQQKEGINAHFFADGPYVAVTGWPNMAQTLSGDGWLGIAPNGARITMRSLDFWRVQEGLIRENWVLVDLLDVYRQIGVDVFKRLNEFNKARNPGVMFLPE